MSAPAAPIPPETVAEFRALALAAGITEAELDAPPTCLAGCKTAVQRLAATCPACAAADARKRHLEAVRRAWRTVPRALHWVRLADAEGRRPIADWVHDATALAAVRKLAANIRRYPWVTLVGPQGAGKTTLAVGLLAEWMAPGASPDASPRDRGWTRRCRFVAAQDLVADRQEAPLGWHVESIDLAREASTLVLDEVGRGGSDPQQVIFRLLHERHRERRPTILTTPYLTARALADATGDGGLARRVFDDAVVIRVGR